MLSRSREWRGRLHRGATIKRLGGGGIDPDGTGAAGAGLAVSLLGEEEEGHQWVFRNRRSRGGRGYLWNRFSRQSAKKPSG